jgi:hypothetical protein
MARLHPDKKEKVVRLITAGVSIKQISATTGIAKSTICYYCKKIRGKKKEYPALKQEFSRVSGEIVGIFAGDGSQYFFNKSYHYEVNIHFGAKNRAYAEYVENLFKCFFQRPFSLSREKQGRIL